MPKQVTDLDFDTQEIDHTHTIKLSESTHKEALLIITDIYDEQMVIRANDLFAALRSIGFEIPASADIPDLK